MTRPYDHSSIQDGHPRSLTDLQDIISLAIPFKLVPKPTRKYLRKLSLEYMCCPDCESKDIIFYGKSSIGTQKYKCSECGYQFVAQFDAYFPRSRRRELFENEFMNNVASIGITKGVGRKEYWEGGLQVTLSYTESQQLKVRINKMIKSTAIQGELDYILILRFIVHEAYVMVTG